MRIGLALFMLSGLAFAGSRDFVVQLGHVGGDQQAAQPYIDQFMRYAEAELKWPANSAHGLFVTKEADAVQYIESQKPGYGIFDAEVFLALHKKYDLQPIASVKIKDLANGRLHVVVKDSKLKSLADLKGKTIVSNYLNNPKYLSRVAFKGLDFEKDATLQSTASPTKGLKAVSQGTAQATIVDDAALPKVKEFDKDLHSIGDSPALPPTVVVSIGKQPDAAAFAKMLLGMCGSAKGASVCQNLMIEKFMPPDKAAYEDAVRRYEK